MKTLLVMRHAKSSWKNVRLSDHDRPLNKRGLQDAPRMGRLLLREEMTPQLIITSSAVRALRTAELVAASCDYENDIAVTREFYHADSETYVDRLAAVSPHLDRVMIVGHNPGMEELVDLLTDAGERITTANIAVIDLPLESWGEIDLDVTGRLRHLWRPREI